MRVNQHLCDRCKCEIDGPYLTLTVNYHHPRTLDICRECETAFTLWLGKHPLWDVDLAEMLKGTHSGAGYPTKDQIEEHQGLMTRSTVKALAGQCNCHFHVPEASPCPIHDL